MPAADSRLDDFVDWASINGVPASRIGDYRRVAEELIGVAGGSRVTESHILRLFDAYADRPGGRVAVTLIEEVGEAMLRHQASRKLAMSASLSAPSVAPGAAPESNPPAPPFSPSSAPISTPPPRSARRNSAETFTARPDERISVELRPPSVPREPSVPPHVVSFASTPDLPMAPVAAPSGHTSGIATAPSRRKTSSQFRCLRCKTMVAADETGVCPRCGSAAPRISSTQLAVVKPSTSSRWWLALALVVAAFALAFRFGPELIDRVRHPSQPMGGASNSTHLGVRLAFPEGWRHATDGDRAPTTTAAGFQAVIPEPVSLRSAHYFRGSPRDPTAELLLSVAPRPPQVTDEVFQVWAARAAATPASLSATLRELSGVTGLSIDRCVVGEAVPGGGLRCVGQASRTRALVFAWPARTVTAVAVFLSSENADAALEEANELIAGLDLS